jgi:hypothetical protein
VSHLFNFSFYTEDEERVLKDIEKKILKPDPSNLSGKIVKIVNNFDNLHHFSVLVHGEPISQETNETSIPIPAPPPVSLEDIFTVHLLNIDRLYAPVLTAKPSFLNPDIPGIFSVP